MWQYLDNFTQQIGHGITALFQVLGNAFVYVYQVLVNQYFIYGVQNVLYGLLWILGGIIINVLIRKLNKNTDLARIDKSAIQTLLYISLVIVMYMGLITIIQTLPMLLNPQYYALQEGARLLNEARR